MPTWTLAMVPRNPSGPFGGRFFVLLRNMGISFLSCHFMSFCCIFSYFSIVNNHFIDKKFVICYYAHKPPPIFAAADLGRHFILRRIHSP